MTNSTTFPGTVTATGFTGTSTNATNAVLATDATDASRPVIFGTGTTGNVPLKTDPGLVYNPSSNKLTAGAFVGDGSELTGISAGFDPDVDIIAIGNGAGTTQQGANAIAIGHDAGSSGTQGAHAIALGKQAGQASQGEFSVAIGFLAGSGSQATGAIAIGVTAGMTSQAAYGIAMGSRAGEASQGDSAVAIGASAAQDTQAANAIAIGYQAGYTQQGTHSVCIGRQAGTTKGAAYGVAIGYKAGHNNNGATLRNHTVAIGYEAGSIGQQNKAVGIGYRAANTNQEVNAVALGFMAGYYGQGQHAVALGAYSGINSQSANSICINATPGTLDSSGINRFHVKPIRNTGAISYNSGTGEFHGNSSDDRVKHNETYITNALRTIMKLKPQTYDKCTSLESNTYIEAHESGFIAQDIWYDVPEMKHIVVLAQTANPTPEKPPAPSDDPRDDPDYSAWGSDLSTLNYTQVIPFLTKAVQEITTELPRSKTTVSNTWGQNITSLVVSANTNKHKTNTVPLVTLSNVHNDKSWYGVVSNQVVDTNDYDTLIDIKGDTQIWVTDVNGPLESGDLLTTSNVAPGYAQKQSDDFIRSFTIGKMTQECDFSEPGTTTLKVPKQELSNVTYYIYQQRVSIDKGEYDRIGAERNKTSENVIAYKNQDIDDSNPMLLVSKLAYPTLDPADLDKYTPVEKTEYYRLDNYESKYQNDAYKGKHTIEEIRQELVDVLDENGQTVWEETGETKPIYTLVNHGTHKAALVTCKLI